MVEPLRKVNRKTAVLYERPPEIELATAALIGLRGSELVRRAGITSQSDADYLRSECIVYLIRQRRLDHDPHAFQSLFKLLRQRMIRALPRPEWGEGSISGRLQDIQDHVLNRFNKYLCDDRVDYCTKLDYFECRFNDAIAKLLLTAKRDIRRRQPMMEGLTDDSESLVPTAEVEEAFAKLAGTSEEEIRERDCRLRALAVINHLPDDQRRVMEMLLNDMPMFSQDPDVVTIASTLRIAERTVRYRRDRAIEAIQAALNDESAK